MATQSGQSDLALTSLEVTEELQQRPGSFDFFQAVRILENVLDRPDAIRFQTNCELAFPASQVEGIEVRASGEADVTVNFLGLVGPMGVLPYFYSELLNDRARAKDFASRAFFDIFHHRLISLFYRAWQKARFPVLWERQQPDPVSSALLAFLGIRTNDLQGRQRISDQDLCFYTGLLGLQTRPAAALQQILADYLQVPVTIDEFCGAWFLLPTDNQCRLGDESCFEQLETGAILGDAVWNQNSRVRVRMGPMPLRRYQQLLPGGTAYQQAEALVDFFGNRLLDVEVQLVLERSQVPAYELGSELPLGWCSWLKTSDFVHDPDDAVLAIGQQVCT